MKLKTIYSTLDKLENEAYINICLLIKNILIKNNIVEWTCYYGGIGTDGNAIEECDIPQKIYDLIEEYEDHFSLFDPQLIISGEEIRSANYKF